MLSVQANTSGSTGTKAKHEGGDPLSGAKTLKAPEINIQ